MDVSELRKRILRAIDEARKDAEDRRPMVDESVKAYEAFLRDIGVPLLLQAAQVLNATGQTFVVHTPAESVRLAAEKSPDTFIEIELDRSGPQPQVIGRVSVTRGRQGLVIEERPLAPNRPVAQVTEDDLSAFLVAEVPKLVLKT
ncbi:MAG: hypothetical protein ABI634_19705 [Acidobacteriota bacterium]